MSRLALAAGLWLALAGEVSAREPAIGDFLVAKPRIGGFFAETVIVLVDHGPQGSAGLIVNRPLGLSLEKLLPDLPEARGHGEPAWLGGPVAPGQLLLLLRASKTPQGAAPVLEGVSLSGRRETLRHWLASPPAGGELRAYVGYSGWAAAQLAGEIERGDWLLVPGDAAAVFTREPAGLWERLLRERRTLEVERGSPAVAPSAKSITLSRPWRSAAASSGSRTSARARSSTR